MKTRALLSLFFACLASVGIAQQPSVQVAPESFEVGSFEFKCPEGWNWIPATGMRKAQLQIPGKEGAAPADITFFHFGPGQGGGVEQNIERWLGQFTDPREKIGAATAKAKVGETNVTMVEAKGTFSSGMPGGPATPLPGYALLGAILESPEGDVFVKLTGPEALVTANKAVFEAMIHAAAKK